MPITDYSLDRQTSFEGHTIIDSNLRVLGLPHQVISKPSLVTSTTLNYPNYCPYGRILCLVGRDDSGINVAAAFPGHFGIVGVTPATTIRKRQFITASTYNPSNNTPMLEAGVYDGKRMSIVNKGYVWMYADGRMLPGETSINYRVDGVTGGDTKAHGRLTTEVSVNTMPLNNCAVVRGNSSLTGGLVLIFLDIPVI